MRFLRHVVSASSVSMDPEKVEAVMSWEAEVSLRDTQFLGISRVLQEVHRGFLPGSPYLSISDTQQDHANVGKTSP